jgi:hypothetical protein
MNKRGMALVFALLVVLVLSILLCSFFLTSINENNLVKRYINSMRAFWVAEAGLAQAIRDIFGVSNSGKLGDYDYTWTSTKWTTMLGNDYYNIVSTGIVTLPGGVEIKRQISAVGKTTAVDPDKFQYSLGSSGDLCFGGNCKGDATKYVHPQPLLPNPPVNPVQYPVETNCYGHDCWQEKNTGINFQNLFNYQASEVKALADHVYTPADFPGTGISGVTWVDVPTDPPGQQLTIGGGSGGDYTSPNGTGILIINGDVELAGNYVFRGIIYIIGKLKARGTFDGYGSVLVAARTEVEESTVNGTPDFFHSKYDITQALKLLVASSARVVSWKETAP